MSKTFQPMGKVKTESEWKPITHHGEMVYCDEEGAKQLAQALAIMAQRFRHIEYKIVEVGVS